ncbi:MAG: hypoxanthine phosphoribosyltransferase [Planctomycetes bacterium]|nr:hypoxanthine phosphoribosyltransferase [Planctomycetota bacterium]MCB9869745.1 hypoxanthine phosphoribosyltransferase [Planctomycetota bacterium]
MHQFRTLIAADAVQRRIGEIAADLRNRYPDTPPCVIAVMEGARVFAEALLRHLPWDVPLEGIRASSYGNETTSGGTVHVDGDHGVDVAGRPVLLLEDIVDTGRTVDRLRGMLLQHGATEVHVATLLSKPSRRVVEVELEHVGFEIPDEFVIGFGMDFAGNFRELDHIAIYEPSAD